MKTFTILGFCLFLAGCAAPRQYSKAEREARNSSLSDALKAIGRGAKGVGRAGSNREQVDVYVHPDD